MRNAFLVAWAVCCVHVHAEPARNVRQCEAEAAAQPAGRARAEAMRQCVGRLVPPPRHFPGGLVEGMSSAQVLESPWGAPREVIRRETPSGLVQEWIYPRGRLYFDGNDHLVNAK